MTTDTPSLTIPPLAVVTIPAMLTLCFTTRVTLATIAQLGHIPPRLYDEAARLGLTVSGPVHYVYEGATGDAARVFTLTIALPIREPEGGTLAAGITYETLPSFRCATYRHNGAWDTLMPTYDGLFSAFHTQGHRYSGHLREAYATVDLERPDRCVTEIQIGCEV